MLPVDDVRIEGVEGVCAILLRLYTSMELLKRIYTSPGPLLEVDYFK
jgi:hypothetical protein